MLRYGDKPEILASSQQILDDLADWLGFLLSIDYLQDVLHKVHGLSVPAARARAKLIVPYVRVALGFISQSLSGPKQLSYLPSYYAILNLMKVYILIGKHHAQLEGNRLHGVTAPAQAKPQSLLTDKVEMKRRGTFSLFYQTLTGDALQSDVTLQIKDFLPLISNVSIEYEFASGASDQFVFFNLMPEQDPNDNTRSRLVVEFPNSAKSIPKNHLKILKDFSSKRGSPNKFYGAYHTTGTLSYAQQLRRHLIYRMHGQQLTVRSPKAVQFPEELPIALLFFYVSTVVRYRPDLLERLGDSREWPVIAASRTHALTAFLLCFWCYVHQKDYFVASQAV